MVRPTEDQLARWRALAETLGADLGGLVAFALDSIEQIELLEGQLVEALDDAAGWSETASEYQRDLEEVREAADELVHAIGRIRPVAATEGDTMAVVDLKTELQKFEAIL